MNECLLKNRLELLGFVALMAVGAYWAVAAETPESAISIGCPDPAVIATDAPRAYYVFSTGEGVPIWRSDDLYHWKRVGRVFDENVPAWAKAAIPKARNVWAPDISFFAGRYHLYYSVSTFGSQRSVIGLAVNRSLDPSRPEYRWEDRGMVLESAPGRTDFNAIDPALVLDRDAAPYLFWGSFWTGIKAARVDPATGKLAGSPPQVVAVARRAKGVDPPAIEGAYVIFRNGFYYLFVSWDLCCAGLESTYKVVVGRSKDVLGPYVDSEGRRMLDGGGTLVVAGSDRWRGPGHNSVLGADGRDWLVHHVYDARDVRLGRILQIRPLDWRDGWPAAGEPLAKPVGKGRNRS
ncbi:MAG: arabinan endo-1,5-alpha-L-arabinosidase [Thermoguttaceae bacterium]|nr:arabinan endo-1,5-alpha-L-arabinosidase [Thermoguttaceae bacterium]